MKPDYSLHEDRYRGRRTQEDVYAGWFTEKDYESSWAEIAESLAPGIPASGRAIDLGCGAGNLSVRLAGAGFTVTGIDVSPTAINWAKERARDQGITVAFHTGSAIELHDFANNTFDLALDSHFIHCVIGEDRPRYLASVHRILKSGGVFLVRSLVWPVASGGGVEVDEESRIGYLDGTAYRQYPAIETLESELVSAGFEINKSRLTVTTNDGYGFQHAVVLCRAG